MNRIPKVTLSVVGLLVIGSVLQYYFGFNSGSKAYKLETTKIKFGEFNDEIVGVSIESEVEKTSESSTLTIPHNKNVLPSRNEQSVNAVERIFITQKNGSSTQFVWNFEAGQAGVGW